MSDSLHLQDISALTNLQSALGRFASDVQANLRAADNEIRRTQEWLRERVYHWQRQVEQARRQVAQAEAALRSCENSGYRDEQGNYYYPDCRSEERAVAAARVHLRGCQANLQKAQMWRSRVEQAANEYQKQAYRLHGLATAHTDKTRAFLGQMTTKYQQVHQTASGNISTSISNTTSIDSPSIRSRWMDRGIQLVDVVNLPEPDNISGSEDFKKVSEDEMRRGLQKWLTMKPIIEGGEGASSDYWAEIDKRENLSYVDGYQRIYEAFYGQNCIRINKSGSSYDIVNGRHRIWLAKRMGISQLPMRVIEGTNDTVE